MGERGTHSEEGLATHEVGRRRDQPQRPLDAHLPHRVCRLPSHVPPALRVGSKSVMSRRSFIPSPLWTP